MLLSPANPPTPERTNKQTLKDSPQHLLKFLSPLGSYKPQVSYNYYGPKSFLVSTVLTVSTWTKTLRSKRKLCYIHLRIYPLPLNEQTNKQTLKDSPRHLLKLLSPLGSYKPQVSYHYYDPQSFLASTISTVCTWSKTFKTLRSRSKLCYFHLQIHPPTPPS